MWRLVGARAASSSGVSATSISTHVPSMRVADGSRFSASASLKRHTLLRRRPQSSVINQYQNSTFFMPHNVRLAVAQEVIQSVEIVSKST